MLTYMMIILKYLFKKIRVILKAAFHQVVDKNHLTASYNCVKKLN